MRWAYVKNGDVLAQLGRLDALPRDTAPSGPDAYLGEWLAATGEQPVLLLSWCGRNARREHGRVSARTWAVTGSRLRRAGNALLSMRAAVSTVAVLLRFRPERIVCGRCDHAFWCCVLVSRVLSVPMVHSVHNAIYGRVAADARGARPWRRWKAAARRAALVRLAGVICNGPTTARQLRDLGVVPERVIEFGIDYRPQVRMMDEAPAPAMVEALSSRDLIVFVGRMAREKGVFDLLDAAVPLLEADPGRALLYVGDGPHLAELEARVRRRGLGERVRFTHRVEHRAIGGILRRATVLVVPTRSSFREGWCKAVVEALVMGVPVIGPDAPPFTDMLDPGRDGLLFATDDVGDLRATLESLLCTPALQARLRAGARDHRRRLLERPPRTFVEGMEAAFRAAGVDPGLAAGGPRRAGAAL